MARAGIGAEVEGVHAVAAAVAAGRVDDLFVERGRLRRPEIRRVVEDATAAGVHVHEVDDVRDLAVSAAPQGLVARARPLPPIDLEGAVARHSPAALIVLDHLEDPHNVGAIARSSLAAGLGAMVVSGRRAAPLGATAFKAAAGALERLPVVVVGSIADSITRLSGLGVWTVALAADGQACLFDMELLTEPVAVVVGGEGRGVSRLVAERADVVARIPMAGATESLNASVAAALAAFEVSRVRARAAAR